MKRRRSRNAMQPGAAIGVLLIAVAATALIGLVGAAFLFRPPPIDADTLCRTDAPVAAHTLLLIDATDRLEPRHRRKLRAVVAQERARLGQHDRLTIMRVNVRRPHEPSILFSKCLPRPPEQTNPLFENARDTQELWDTAFGDALDRALRGAGAGAGARSSPIIAATRAAAADPDFGPEIAARRFVLVSDLLEHDPQGFSLYADSADFAAWRAASPTEPPDLTHIDVRLVPLDRPDHVEAQARARDGFWPAFFDAAGAQSVSIDPAP
ncbi:MAG: hypothetical protein K2X34_07660 [Hyphomonadaceae bacterium]|nr:hypothetical protein [Hyphomonadaceae bacterium]